MSDFEKEERYYVFKKSDIEKNTSVFIFQQYEKIQSEYNELRRQLGKKPLECVVVESDWPMYNRVWKLIKNWAITQKKGRYVLPHRSGGGIPSNPECSICGGWCGGGYEGKPCEFKG